jgi:hypothetical protein
MKDKQKIDIDTMGPEQLDHIAKILYGEKRRTEHDSVFRERLKQMMNRSFITRGTTASCDAVCTAVLYEEVPASVDMARAKRELAILWLRRTRPIKWWKRLGWALKIFAEMWRWQ